MSSSLFSDDALSAATLALKGLTARHQTISSNIANVDTPGYSAKQVDFETTLQRSLNSPKNLTSMAKTNKLHLDSSTSTASFLTTSNRAGGTYREDGNNVDIDTELMDMAETNIKYQAISQRISGKLLLLKAIAQGG
ncbi:MAG: flagellar basal body rod protein FlgB [Anaerolineaceae bacterium]|nr:flagellar basal body rod protein FlgB [Anaerolineaceae bacterium]